MSGLRLVATLALSGVAPALFAQSAPSDAAKAFGAREIAQSAPFNAAKAFGSRESVTGISLSPDGQKVAYVAPTSGQGAVGYVLSIAPGSVPKPFISVDANPDRLGHCYWVANDRLACQVFYLSGGDPSLGAVPHSRVIAVNADGSNLRELSTREHFHTRGEQLGGGVIIDLLPGEDSAVLMMRNYLPDDHIGSRLGSDKKGLGVDWINTRDLTVKHVETPRPEAIEYITDSRGAVRIFANKVLQAGLDSSVVTYFYRTPGS